MAKIDFDGDGDGDLSKGMVKLAIGLIFAPKQTLVKIDNMLSDGFIMLFSVFMKCAYVVITVIVPLLIGSHLSYSDSYFTRFCGNLLFAGSLIHGVMSFRVWLNDTFSIAELLFRTFFSLFFVSFPLFILSREENGWLMTALLYGLTFFAFFMFIVALFMPMDDDNE